MCCKKANRASNVILKSPVGNNNEWERKTIDSVLQWIEQFSSSFLFLTQGFVKSYSHICGGV